MGLIEDFMVLFVNFCNDFKFFFMGCVMVYFAIFGIVNLRYAFKSKNNPEKKNHPEYFINELLVAIMFFVLVILYPFIFDIFVQGVSDPESVLSQIYFHVWDSLTVQLVIWNIYLFFAQKNDKKHNRAIVYNDWKELVVSSYKEGTKSNLQRKAMHSLAGIIIVSLYYAGVALESSLIAGGWDSVSFSMFLTVCVGVHFIWIMNIFDLLRLNEGTFTKMGQFARTWSEKTIHPNEMNTFASATIMIMALIPFIILPPSPALLISISLIGAIADAMASIVGKKFGKIRSKKEGTKKTAEGYIAGSLTAYLLVLLVHSIWQFGSLGLLEVNIIAIGAGLAIFIVDKYLSQIVSDNFLNPVACGLVIFILYSIFSML
ncbi:MAG: hypothetical protein GY870_15290 [archaeon]|nr:hypothetical protein [archaeon]